jgi:hypothetical protein
MRFKSSATVPVVIDVCPSTLERSHVQVAGCRLVDQSSYGAMHCAVGASSCLTLSIKKRAIPRRGEENENALEIF